MAVKAKKKAKPAKRQTQRGKTKVRRVSYVDRLLMLLPVSEEGLQKGFTGLVMAVILTTAYFTASFFGVPEMAKQEFASLAGRAGFEVKRVEVTGVNRVDELKVYEITLAQKNRAMPLVDVDQIRADLLEYGWIKEARVSRRLPDTLVVEIIEREPSAVWKDGNKLALIDAQGIVLDKIAPSVAPDLPMVSGPEANTQVVRLAALLDEAPALRPMIIGAAWVGKRRWNLTFKSGETLALPEGEAAAAVALVDFARMDGINRLLGRGVVHFDLRDPERAYMRMPPKPKPTPTTSETTKS